jgi:hypothetical protein
LGPASSSAQAAPVQEGIIAAADPGTTAAKPASKLLDLFRPRPRAEKRAEDERTIASDLRQTSESSSRATRSEEEAAGQSQSGRQANTRSSNNANNSSGTPSNQKTPSKAADEDEPQDEPKPDAKDRPKTPEAKKAEEQQASSSTSGQGQSKSSSSDTSNIPADDQPDRAGGNKEDDVDEEGIQDEVEEEKTSGVERPSLRKNKPPVDRNLSPLPTGDEPSPTANGRSGPGGRKKTRGVQAMILGVPVPDRIQGMKNPGRSKVTQENSTPKEEPQASLNAESRQPREAAFGPVEHPLLLPWMQSLVRQYFLQLRETPKAQR